MKKSVSLIIDETLTNKTIKEVVNAMVEDIKNFIEEWKK